VAEYFNDPGADIIVTPLRLAPAALTRSAPRPLPPPQLAGFDQAVARAQPRPARADLAAREVLIQNGAISARDPILWTRQLNQLPNGRTSPIEALDADPFSAIGRLEISFASRKRRCSFFLVASNVALTAAHCIYAQGDGGERASEFPLALSLRLQARPGGEAQVLRGHTILALRGWINPRDGAARSPYDVAAIVLEGHVSANIHWASLRFGGPLRAGASVLAAGYPDPKPGERSFGPQAFQSAGPVLGIEGGVVAAQNALTEGASGGPWFALQYGHAAAIGLNSTKPVGNDARTFSPIFDARVADLLAAALARQTGV